MRAGRLRSGVACALHAWVLWSGAASALESEAYGNIGPGTLYRTIEQLLASGLIGETDRRPVPELDDERRRYYRLTPFGRRVAVAEADRLADLLKAASVRKLTAVPYRS